MLNVANYETGYLFLDGGLDIIGGNYFVGERGQGAYISGVLALRWVLCELGIAQPRRLTGELRRPPCESAAQNGRQPGPGEPPSQSTGLLKEAAVT
jgi:hypothetical protein